MIFVDLCKPSSTFLSILFQNFLSGGTTLCSHLFTLAAIRKLIYAWDVTSRKSKAQWFLIGRDGSCFFAVLHVHMYVWLTILWDLTFLNNAWMKKEKFKSKMFLQANLQFEISIVVTGNFVNYWGVLTWKVCSRKLTLTPFSTTLR